MVLISHSSTGIDVGTDRVQIQSVVVTRQRDCRKRGSTSGWVVETPSQ